MTNNVIAAYCLCNTASVNIYDIDYTEDKVLAGINDQEPEWCQIDYNDEDEDIFRLGELEVPLNQCMRV